MDPEQTNLQNALAAAGAQIARDFRAAMEKLIPVYEAIRQAVRAAMEKLIPVYEAIGQAVRAAAEAVDQAWSVVVAYKWAERAHPEWVKIMRRTKKRRIRKKYADRIWRAYLKEGETPSKT
jgi:uncharacterized protein YukE